jgi:hypothetical protein
MKHTHILIFHRLGVIFLVIQLFLALLGELPLMTHEVETFQMIQVSAGCVMGEVFLCGVTRFSFSGDSTFCRDGEASLRVRTHLQFFK